MTNAPTLTFDAACKRVKGGADPHAIAADFVECVTLDVKLECLDGDEDFWSENVNHAFALGEGKIGSLEIS